MFRDRTPTSPRKPEQPGNLYFAIALTALSAESGAPNFFPQGTSGVDVLEPGDGVICRGEDMNPSGGGEGGIILMIVYQDATGGEPGYR
jgi:hypothetical protein